MSGLRLAVIAVAFGMAAPVARAATIYTAYEQNTGNWSTAANWTPDGVPGAVPANGDSIVVTSTNNTTRTRTITVDGAYTISRFAMDWTTTNFSNATKTTYNLTGDNPATSKLTVTGSIEIGQAGIGGWYAFNDTLTFSNMTLQVGSSTASRGTITVGCANAGGDGAPSHFLTAGANSTFIAYLSGLRLGGRLQTGQSKAVGTLDLGAATCSSTIDVSGTVNIGVGFAAGGTLKLNNGTMSVTNGDLNLCSDNQDYATAALYLTNSTLTVASGYRPRIGSSSSVNAPSSIIDITVNGVAGGLRVLNNAADGLYFNNPTLENTSSKTYQRIKITLRNPAAGSADGWFWGLQWAGNHVSSNTQDYDTAGNNQCGLRWLTTDTYNTRLLIDFSALSVATRQGYLAKLQQWDPTTYGSKTYDQLTATDFIQYDSTTGSTYVGYYSYTATAPAPTLTISTANNLRVLAGATINIAGAVGNGAGTDVYNVSGTVTQGVGGLTVSSVSPSPMGAVAMGGSVGFTAVVNTGASLGTQAYNLSVTDAATPVAHVGGATHNFIVGLGVASGETYVPAHALIANVFDNSDLDGLSSTITPENFSATLLDGKTLASGGAQDVAMNWRWPTSDERDSNLMVTNIVDLTLNVTKLVDGKYVLEMGYTDQDVLIVDELAMAKAGLIHIAYNDPVLGWVNAGTQFVGLTAPGNEGLTMSWSDLGSSTTAGDWGVEVDTHRVWVVLNHASEFGVSVVPEPATLGFLALGGLSMIGAAIRRRRA